MQRSFEYQSPQFVVNAKFDSFSALKHACTRAALLDVYEFVPDGVDSERYTRDGSRAEPCSRTRVREQSWRVPSEPNKAKSFSSEPSQCLCSFDASRTALC